MIRQQLVADLKPLGIRVHWHENWQAQIVPGTFQRVLYGAPSSDVRGAVRKCVAAIQATGYTAVCAAGLQFHRDKHAYWWLEFGCAKAEPTPQV